LKQLELSPTRYLVIVNALAAAVGFFLNLFVARLLGPEQLGGMAVVTGIVASVAAFVDIRFNDVAAKLFYETEGKEPAQAAEYQTGVLWMAVAGSTMLALITALTASLIGNYLMPHFTSIVHPAWWLPLAAAALAFKSISSAAGFLLRLSRRYYELGTWRLITVVASAAITLTVLAGRRDLSGYFLAIAVAGVVQLLFTGWSFHWVWTRGAAGWPLYRPRWKEAWAAYRRCGNVLWYGNLMGYAKLFQRSADVLVVAYFAGDRETGLYKLARQLVDQGLAVLQEAIYQVHYPTLLDAFTRRADVEFRRLARYLAQRAALGTALLLTAEALLLPFLVGRLLGPAYAGAEPAIVILSATFVFIVGFHPWLWAIFVGGGSLLGYTVSSFLAVAVQYGSMAFLFWRFRPGATMAMWGLFAHYLCLIPLGIWLVHRRWPAYIPRWRPAP